MKLGIMVIVRLSKSRTVNVKVGFCGALFSVVFQRFFVFHLISLTNTIEMVC